jgi:hypothetical protein
MWIDGKLIAPVPPEEHGRKETRSNWGCECDPCGEAYRAWWRDYHKTHRRKTKVPRRRRSAQAVRDIRARTGQRDFRLRPGTYPYEVVHGLAAEPSGECSADQIWDRLRRKPEHFTYVLVDLVDKGLITRRDDDHAQPGRFFMVPSYFQITAKGRQAARGETVSVPAKERRRRHRQPAKPKPGARDRLVPGNLAPGDLAPGDTVYYTEWSDSNCGPGYTWRQRAELVELDYQPEDEDNEVDPFGYLTMHSRFVLVRVSQPEERLVIVAAEDISTQAPPPGSPTAPTAIRVSLSDADTSSAETSSR